MTLWRKTDDDQGAQVLAFPGAEVVPASHPMPAVDELAEAQLEPDTSPWVPARLRTWVEQTKDRRLLPDPRRVVNTTEWYWEHAPQLAVRGAGRGLRTCVREVWLTLRGGGWLLACWGRWVSDADWRRTDKDIYLKISESAYRVEKREHRARLKVHAGVSATGVLVLGGGGAWATLEWPHWSAVGWTALVGTLNAIGHWTRPTSPDAPEPEPEFVLLAPNVPLHKLRETIIWVLKVQQGIEDLKADTLLWLEPRKQYRMRVTTQHEMGDKDLRAIERRIGAAVKTITMLDTDISATRELVIPSGDSLSFASMPTCPWVPTGSISVNEPITLGVSSADHTFSLRLAGHISIVAATGGGKTKWALWVLIDLLSACVDVVLWQVGVRKEPDMTLWGGVLQRTARTPEEAKEVLDAAINELERRQAIIDDLAADDDPTNDRNEWATDMGPALFVILDEFALLVRYPELLERVEYITREGRKVMVFLIRASQKTGNTDHGSTLMQGQSNIDIALPCTRDDADKMFDSENRKEGWEPHKLKAGVIGNPHDAGKCYVLSGELTTPDVYRFYRPLSNGEIKRRRARRLADGLPALTGATTLDAQLVDPGLAAIEAALNFYGTDRLPSELVVGHANAHGGSWDQVSLAAAVKSFGVETRRARSEAVGGGPRMCYHREDITTAMRRL